MFLSEYIKVLQEMMVEFGDTDMLYTAIDEEGNGYNKACYAPECRLLSPHDDEHRPENLIEPKSDGEPLEDWLDHNCLDEDDIPSLKKVILL